MKKRIRYFELMALILMLLLVMTSPSRACLFRQTPDLENLEQYAAIFIGKVASVTLRKDSIFAASDLTMPHDMTVEVLEAIEGRAAETVHLKHVTGCGIAIPEPGQIGVFFLGGRTGLIPIYESEGWPYEKLMRDLASR